MHVEEDEQIGARSSSVQRARLRLSAASQVARHEALLGPVDGRAAESDLPRNLLVTGAGIRSQQNLRALELVSCVPAAAEEAGPCVRRVRFG
jgi:hypothetical protein